MQFLKATLPGKYLDGFLYRGQLYLLLRDSSLALIDWDELISARCPGPGGTIDPLAELLFLDNSLARVDARMLRWSGYPELRSFFSKRLLLYQDIELDTLQAKSIVDLDGRATHSIELYYSHVWLTGESGVSVCQYGPGFREKGKRSRLSNVISGHSFSSTLEKRFLWVSQRGTTIGLPIDDIASKRVGISFGKYWELPFSALSVGWHWSDPTFASRDEHSSRAFVRANWLESQSNERHIDPRIQQRRQAAVKDISMTPVSVDGGKKFLEIDLGGLAHQRLFCSRDRAIALNSKLTGLEWDYDLSIQDLEIPEVTPKHGRPERVLIGTFGWVVEGDKGVAAYTRNGCVMLARGEVVQVRTFPSSIRYENMILIIHDDRAEIISMLDYDFLVSPEMRTPSIGRKSEFYSKSADDPSWRHNTRGETS